VKLCFPNPEFCALANGDLVRSGGPYTLVRRGFKTTHSTIETGMQLRATLRNGPYAWPGGYPLYFITNDGSALSFEGVLDRLESEIREIRNRFSGRIVACDVNWEDNDLFCEITGKRIECAYGD